MDKHSGGSMYGLNFKTNIKLPYEFPFTINKKNNNYKSIMINKNFIVPDCMEYYSESQFGAIKCYKNNQHKFFLTDKIGGIYVTKDYINYIPLKTSDNIDKESILLSYGIGISSLLRMNCYTILHATALLIQNKVVLFMGQSGVGKSTLCSFFIKNSDAKLIADDMSVISPNNKYIYTGFPTMRLWPDTINEILSIDLKQLINVGRNEKKYLDINKYCNKKINIGKYTIDTVIFLKEHIENGNSVNVENISKIQAALLTTKHIYAKYSLDSLEFKTEVNSISSIINKNKINFYSISYERKYDILALVCKRIKSII